MDYITKRVLMVKGFVIVFAATAMFFFADGSAHADFYKYVDEDGVAHYTNTAPDSEFEWYMPEERARLAVQGSGKGSEYHLIINSAANKFGVDTSLVKAIIKAESDFDPSAVSKAGAVGLMQLMPDTARDLGVRDRYDPRENIHGGVKYIKRLLTRFDGNVSLALAAYNAGGSIVERYGKVPPFDETRGFVKKVLRFQREYEFTGRN